MRALLLALVLCCSSAWAASLTVEWTHPTQYTDGKPLVSDEILATEIQYGACDALNLPPASGAIQSVPWPAVRWVHDGLAYGQKVCYRARTVGRSGVSDWTGGVWGRTPSKPGSVTGVEIR